MARNQGPSSDDPFYRPGQAGRNSFADDALPPDAALMEDEEEDEQLQFRRADKRVPVRRGALPRKTASRVRAVVVVLLVIAALARAGIHTKVDRGPVVGSADGGPVVGSADGGSRVGAAVHPATAGGAERETQGPNS